MKNIKDLKRPLSKRLWRYLVEGTRQEGASRVDGVAMLVVALGVIALTFILRWAL